MRPFFVFQRFHDLVDCKQKILIFGILTDLRVVKPPARVRPLNRRSGGFESARMCIEQNG